MSRLETPCSATLPRRLKDAHDGNTPETIRKSLRDKWPAEFCKGARCGFLHQEEGSRRPGSYPPGFVHWQPERRNAWFAGFNVGFHDRLRFSKAEAA
jgi:hypothetical protein